MTTPNDAPALYLRCGSIDELDAAVSAGAAGVSYALGLVRNGIAAVGDVPLEQAVDAALGRGLAVELVDGELFAHVDSAGLLAAAVAALVSARLAVPEVRLTSFDHAAVAGIGGSAPGLTLGLRHIATLHAGERYAARLGVQSLHPVAGAGTPDQSARARKAGLRSHAWTIAMPGWPVDEESQLREALATEVDAVTVGEIRLLSLIEEAAR